MGLGLPTPTPLMQDSTKVGGKLCTGYIGFWQWLLWKRLPPVIPVNFPRWIYGIKSLFPVSFETNYSRLDLAHDDFIVANTTNSSSLCFISIQNIVRQRREIPMPQSRKSNAVVGLIHCYTHEMNMIKNIRDVDLCCVWSRKTRNEKAVPNKDGPPKSDNSPRIFEILEARSHMCFLELPFPEIMDCIKRSPFPVF